MTRFTECTRYVPRILPLVVLIALGVGFATVSARPGSSMHDAETLIQHWHLPELRKRVDTGDAAKAEVAANGKDRDPRFWFAWVNSFLMILVSEMGDETWIIAALMAMRHPKAVVFGGAIGALIVMTIISTALGFVVPNLISASLVHHLATGLYTLFGCRLFYIAYTSTGNEMKEEMEEVEEKFAGDKSHSKFRRFFSRFCTPVFLEAFILTFLAEWGDRSQIATITLAAHQNPYGVTVGGIIGHMVCTGIACLGGEQLGLKISQRSVACVGGALFFVFAFINFLKKD